MTATVARPVRTASSAAATEALGTTGVSAPKCSRAMAAIASGPAAATVTGDCMPVVPASISRHIRTKVRAGSWPVWRATRRRRMAASRPGRKAAVLPDRATPSTTRARAMSRSWILSSISSRRARKSPKFGRQPSSWALASVAWGGGGVLSGMRISLGIRPVYRKRAGKKTRAAPKHPRTARARWRIRLPAARRRQRRVIELLRVNRHARFQIAQGHPRLLALLIHDRPLAQG